jgi:hypothetical protein
MASYSSSLYPPSRPQKGQSLTFREIESPAQNASRNHSPHQRHFHAIKTALLSYFAFRIKWHSAQDAAGTFWKNGRRLRGYPLPAKTC